MDPYFGISGCGPRPVRRVRRVGLPESARALALLRADLAAAAAMLAGDADQAALLLDGVVARIAACWYARHGEWEPGVGDQLADLARRDAPFARRLWLALRAPDPAARLEHARQLLRALDAGDSADAPDLDADLSDNLNDVSAPRVARMARAAGSRERGW